MIPNMQSTSASTSLCESRPTWDSIDTKTARARPHPCTYTLRAASSSATSKSSLSMTAEARNTARVGKPARFTYTVPTDRTWDLWRSFMACTFHECESRHSSSRERSASRTWSKEGPRADGRFYLFHSASDIYPSIGCIPMVSITWSTIERSLSPWSNVNRIGRLPCSAQCQHHTEVSNLTPDRYSTWLDRLVSWIGSTYVIQVQ